MEDFLQLGGSIQLSGFSGVDGGQIVAEGIPKDVAKNKKSFTAKYLKNVV